VADRHAVSSELSRDLTLFQVIMMGLGMMIGAGVFVGMGLSIKSVGPGGVVLTFALNGMIALFTAMSFAELSSAIPRAGGAYNFARIGFGRGASFIAGWMEWFASSLAGAFYAIVFSEFTLRFILGMGGWKLGAAEPWVVKGIALAAAGAFIYINYRGSSETGKIGAIFTVGQMVFVVAIAVVGVVTAIFRPDRLANFDPFMPHGWLPLLGSMGVIYVAFEGFEVIAQAGDEVVDPKRNIPKAMLYSVLIVTLTYVGVALATVVSKSFAETGGVPVHEWLADKGGIDAFREASKGLLGSGFGAVAVTLAVIFSSTSALNATIYSATRASYALGRDHMLPPAVAKISRTRKTPYVALGLTAVIVLMAAALLNPESGAATTSIMFLFLFFLVNVCCIRIRMNMGDELEYGYLMPLFPLFPILGIVCQIAVAGGIVTHSWVAWVIGPGWVLAGVGVYLVYSRTRAVATADEIAVLEEREAPDEKPYNVMVAVADPENALELVSSTYKLCGAKDAKVELLHMVPVPDQVPLSDADKYMREGKEGVIEAMLSLGLAFPISTTLRYCRNAARGIVSAVREKKTDMLIMGFRGGPSGRSFRLGSKVDPIIERTPCNVVMLKDCGGNRTFSRVLVPLAGGPNGAFALEVASILADDAEGEIVAFTVSGGKRKFDIDEFVTVNADRIHLPAGRVSTRTAAAGNVVDTILWEAEDYDLIVIGCTLEPIISRFTHDTLPEIVAKRCGKPLVMVKSGGGIRSWIRRWF